MQSLNAGLIPRSVNAGPLDPEVDLAITIDGSQAVSKRDGDPLLLKNAFGFGGHNISVLLSAPAGSTPERRG